MVVNVKNFSVKKRDFGKAALLVDGVLKATNLIVTFERLRESLSSRSMFRLLLILFKLALLMFIRPSLASVCRSSWLRSFEFCLSFWFKCPKSSLLSFSSDLRRSRSDFLAWSLEAVSVFGASSL